MDSRRNVVLPFGGTGNSQGELEQTNAWRTCEAIDVEGASAHQDHRRTAARGADTTSAAALLIQTDKLYTRPESVWRAFHAWPHFAISSVSS
jgi:hypothetical protein